MLQPGDPDPERPVRRVPAHQIGNDLLRQQLEGLGVAEEAGDVDQQVLGEELELAGVPAAEASRYRPLSSMPASAMRRSIRRRSVPGL